jgi:hypothetical protein
MITGGGVINGWVRSENFLLRSWDCYGPCRTSLPRPYHVFPLLFLTKQIVARRCSSSFRYLVSWSFSLIKNTSPFLSQHRQRLSRVLYYVGSRYRVSPKTTRANDDRVDLRG